MGAFQSTRVFPMGVSKQSGVKTTSTNSAGGIQVQGQNSWTIQEDSRGKLCGNGQKDFKCMSV